jgi:CheY-like chemotaxis protein
MPRLNNGQAPVRVLVVEDNAGALRVLVSLLTRLGCDAIGFTDGAESIDAAREHQPHLVVLDLSMPGIDGFETARRLHAAGLPPFKLVALTSLGDAQTMQRCAAANFEVHVHKPIDIVDLQLLVEEARTVPNFDRAASSESLQPTAT